MDRTGINESDNSGDTGLKPGSQNVKIIKSANWFWTYGLFKICHFSQILVVVRSFVERNSICFIGGC